MSEVSERLVAQHRRTQLSIRRRFLREFFPLWDQLAWQDLDGTFPGWVRSVMRALRQYRQESADAAVTHYQRLRLADAPQALVPAPEPVFVQRGGAMTLAQDAHQGLTKAERIRLDDLRTQAVARRLEQTDAGRRPIFDWSEAKPAVIDWGPEDDRAEKSLLITGPGELKRLAKLRQDERKAKRAALVLASGTAARLVVDGGRTTTQRLVKVDPVAQTWSRTTGPSPCSFCVMLASRGPVYKSRVTAAFQPHDNCMCQATPVFSRDDWVGRDQQREWAALWKEVTKGYSGHEARKAFRRHWEGLQREQAASTQAA